VKEDFEFISGSRMRQMAKDGETPPPGFMGPKGWDVLAEYYKNCK
jgi:3'-phosphoadenosine 5'-phosphosulfate synthase